MRKVKTDIRSIFQGFYAVLATLLFAAAASASVIFSGCGVDIRRSDDKVYPAGTVIDGVSIEGMTALQAKELLFANEQRFVKAYKCVMHLGNESFVLTSEDIPVMTDLEELLKTAFSGGRYELSYRIGAYRARLAAARIAEEVDRESPDDPFEFSLARFPEGERFRIKEGSEGVTLDRAACADYLVRGVTEFELPIQEPEGGKTELPELRGSFETSFRKGGLNRSERVFNIIKASELINGSVIRPYDTISCNEAMGERTEKNGWQLAPGIIDGGADVEDQPGGGVCQVTSTLFNAALYADMAVISRTAHSRPVSYTDPGRDATVVTGGTDLVLKNTTSSFMYVFCWSDAEEGTVRCEIWGQPMQQEIEVETELAETIPPTEDEYELDESLGNNECVEDNPAITGYRYVTYRIKTKAGETPHREAVAVSEYRMHPRRFRCGQSYYERIMNAAPASAKTARLNLTPTPKPNAKSTPTPTAEPLRTEDPASRRAVKKDESP